MSKQLRNLFDTIDQEKKLLFLFAIKKSLFKCKYSSLKFFIVYIHKLLKTAKLKTKKEKSLEDPYCIKARLCYLNDSFEKFVIYSST